MLRGAPRRHRRRARGAALEEAYLALGARQSIFAAGEREAPHALFERYRDWLDATGLYDPNLVAQRWLPLAEPRYDFIVVDEVQDMTNAELTLALRMLRRPGQFLPCGDANQIVHPNFFSWARLRGLFFRDDALGDTRSIGVLDANYRTARAVTRTANVLFFVNALYVALTRAVKNVYLVERDRDHPLLALLGARTEADALAVRGEASSLEEWQAEARRLEQQGKLEQAEAIRQTVARTEKVPWTVIDARGHDELAGKALAPNSVFTKAKQALFDWSCFHDNVPLAVRLARSGFAPAARYATERAAVVRRQLVPFAGRHFKDVLSQTDRFGVDYRTPMGTTPLMMAAAAGNAALVEALLARGARRDLVDPFGRAPMHHALRSAYAARASPPSGWPRSGSVSPCPPSTCWSTSAWSVWPRRRPSTSAWRR